MRVLLALLIALASRSTAAPRAKKLSAFTPCYIALTAIVSDSARVRRVVTTGVRRTQNANADVSALLCTSASRARIDTLKRAVTAQLGTQASRAQWLSAQTTDSVITGDHLRRLAKAAAPAPSIDVVHVAPDTDLVVVPPAR